MFHVLFGCSAQAVTQGLLTWMRTNHLQTVTQTDNLIDHSIKILFNLIYSIQNPLQEEF